MLVFVLVVAGCSGGSGGCGGGGGGGGGATFKILESLDREKREAIPVPVTLQADALPLGHRSGWEREGLEDSAHVVLMVAGGIRDPVGGYS